MEREGALALLNAQHTFPGPFEFRVVLRPTAKVAVLTAIAAAAGGQSKVTNVGERTSSKGAYTALNVTVELPSAESVLDVYAVLGQIDDVMVSL